MPVPRPLHQAIERREWVPFLGPAPDPDAPTPADLARLLAADLDPPTNGPLPQVAQAYALAHGTAALRQRVIAHLRDPSLAPTAVHHLLARLPLNLVITTAQHTLLETALRTANRTVNVIVTQEDLAFYDEKAVNVVKLWGDVTRPDTLILTEKEHLTLFDTSPLLADVIRAALATRTLVFLGLDLEDAALRQLIFQVTRLQGRHKRRAYAVCLWPAEAEGRGPSAITRRYWEEEQVIILDQTPAGLLLEIDRAMAVPAAAPPKPEPRARAPLPRRPYKFLDPYQAADEPLFFGREQETRLLAQKVLAHRLVVLTGPLGVGKTSLVQAGLTPELEGQGWRVVPIRLLEDIGQAVQRSLEAAGLPVSMVRSSPPTHHRRYRIHEGETRPYPANLPLGELIAQAERQVEERLLLVFDSFEELFTRAGPAAQRAAGKALAEALGHPDVDARLLLVLRGDYLMSLAALEQELPEAFHNIFPLAPLSVDQAVAALTGPLRALGLRMEEGLAQEIAEALKDSEGYVLPSQLQIIADRLYDDLIARGGDTITAADYERLGRAEELLRSYLGALLERIPHARPVLEALVGEEGRRCTSDVEAIAQATSLGTDTVQTTLEALHEGRVLSPLTVDGRLLWELSHDLLAQTLWAWLGDEAQERARAQAVLERAWADWKASAALPDPRRLDFVAARWTFLPPLSPGLQGLLLRAAVSADHRIEDWLRRVPDADVRRDVLLALAEAEEPEVRARALPLLATHLPPEAALPVLSSHTLDDAERRVRRAAVLAWHGIQPQAAWEALQEASAQPGPPGPGPAVQALADLWDAERVSMSDGLRAGLPVWLEFSRLRLQADSPRWWRRGLAGAIGGAVGMGLGLALAALAEGHVFVALTVVPWGATFGLLAGLGLGLGLGLGDALRLGNARRARMVGSGLLGGLSTAVAGTAFLAFLWAVCATCPWAWLLVGMGIGVGLGAVTSAWLRPGTAALGGAVVGGIVALLKLLTGSPLTAPLVGLLLGLLVAAAIAVSDRGIN
ncbi:MAG: SIR2 family protein [Anaerolineae bacterium]|nr:SIR2 family protein [Anaerolineae bacterium]